MLMAAGLKMTPIIKQWGEVVYHKSYYCHLYFGLATIDFQVKPYNIYVTVAFPPDTDTPLLAEENKSKVP